MGIENTTTIAGLKTTNPHSTDSISEGPNHFWLIKNVLKGIFPGRAGQGFAQPLIAFEDDINALTGMSDAPETRQKTLVNIIKDLQGQIDAIKSGSGGGGGSGGGASAYPIGSIFLSAVDTNPTLLLGYGSWSRIAHGRALFGVEEGSMFNGYASQGGSRHAIVPEHTHIFDTVMGLAGAGEYKFKDANGQYGGTPSGNAITVPKPSNSAPITNANLPPYFAVYVWKRDA